MQEHYCPVRASDFHAALYLFHHAARNLGANEITLAVYLNITIACSRFSSLWDCLKLYVDFAWF